MEKPNVFLITIDCLRADYLGCLGKDKDLTPNLDALAKQGIVFSQAISNGPYTKSSFPSILTSTYSRMYPDMLRISDSRISIAEVLKKNGYKTAGFNTNPLLSRFFFYNKGFDYFFDILSNKRKISSDLIDKIRRLLISFLKKTPLKKLLQIMPLEYYYTNDARKINQEVLAFLNKKTNNVFIWMHYMDVHIPYYPPKRLRKISYYKTGGLNKIIVRNPPKVSQDILQNIINLYKGEIRLMDEELGIFIKELKKLNIFNKSLFIITADHGDEFKEHGDFSHLPKLYDELIHVPLIIAGPIVPNNIKINNIVSTIDIAPTILDYLNMVKNEEFMGKSLMPLLKESNEEYNREGVISEIIASGPLKISYRTEKWKLIIDEINNDKEFYNLETDPYETRNVYTQYKELTSEFEQVIAKHILFEEKMHNKAREMQKIKAIANRIKIKL